jgi:ATP-dependent DNA ligase I
LDYSVLAEAYQKIESTTKRLDMTAHLVGLFRRTPPAIIRKLVYLTQGRLYPDFMSIELGVADKLAIRAISFVTGASEDDVTRRWMKEGDLGLVAEELVAVKKQRTLFSEPLTVERVYSSLQGIAGASGPGAQDLKMKLIADILHDARPLEAKFILRTLLGKLRLGVADMTILDALAVTFAPKESPADGQSAAAPDALPPAASKTSEPVLPALEPAPEPAPEPPATAAPSAPAPDGKAAARKAKKAEREAKAVKRAVEEAVMAAELAARRRNRAAVEHAYNLCSDLGEIAERLATEGMEGVRKIKLEAGRPVRPMLAERLGSMEEILGKLGGKASLEYKYDGMRIQAHIRIGKEVRLYSRQLENVTEQFPDVVANILQAFQSRDFEEAMVDCEAVPLNTETGEFLPFQEVSHRRGRKYGVDAAVEDYPVILMAFDCLQLDGRELIGLPYPERRKALARIFRATDRVQISESLLTSDLPAAESFFQKALDSGCEGIIAKSVSEDSAYRAGARGWQWIKFKRDYKSEMEDTADLVPVGAFAGHGKRKGKYGALLMAAYNKDLDRFETVCKLGTGFSDDMLEKMTAELGQQRIPERHARVESAMKADYWLVPTVVYEVLGAEITLSPIHTAGFGKLRSGSGLAIRFPRLKQVRTDKKPEDATSVQELVEMYERQLKKVE